MLFIDNKKVINVKVDFVGGKDKLTVNGTLILNSAQFDSNVTLAGKGEIVMTDTIYSPIGADIDDKFSGKVFNLGATADGYRNKSYELADNISKKAVKLDAYEDYAGWLGNVDGLNDSIDFIKFTNKESVEVKLRFSNFESAVVELNGNLLTINETNYQFSVSSGDILSIKLEDKTSISYTNII